MLDRMNEEHRKAFMDVAPLFISMKDKILNAFESETEINLSKEEVKALKLMLQPMLGIDGFTENFGLTALSIFNNSSLPGDALDASELL